MIINDKSAFLPHKRILKVKTIGGEVKKFPIALNLNVDTYYTVLCLFGYMDNVKDNKKVEYLLESVTKILKSSEKRITKNWIVNNIGIVDQMEIVTQVINGTNELLNEDFLQIPDIQIPDKSTNNKYDKDRKRKRESIKQSSKLLAKKQNISLIDDITLVMMKTGNTYKDILQMPILVFRAIVKSIVINEMRTDDDYNLAYLKYELNKYSEELNSGQAVMQPSNKGANLTELKQFFG